MNLRVKILLTYVALTLAGILAVGLFSSWRIRAYFEERLEDHLIADVTLLGTMLSDGTLPADSTAASDDRLRRYAVILDVRLTLIRRDGVVIFDSDVPRDSLPGVANHLQRPEIAQSRHERIGHDRRQSKTVQTNLMYVATRVVGTGALDSGYVRVALPVEHLEALESQIQTIVLSVALVISVILILVSTQVSKRISLPILNILQTAEAIKNGDLNQRIPVSSSDEIGSLSTAINDMAEKLSSDISRLKKLERVRSEFLGNVSHELRTPIFSIQGFLETLLDGAVDDPGVNREFLEKAYRHAERLNTLLNDLIEISRIESGDMKMSFRYFSILEFVQQIVEEMRPAAARKNLAMTIVPEVDADDNVYGDRDRLRQVMTNLIDNAIKYTDAGGSIVCRIRKDKGVCKVTIEDTGCGIAGEHLPRIFERFYRVDRDRSREVGGTGLGLAIVKHIVEAHGGTLHVASVPRQGSQFTFTLKR